MGKKKNLFKSTFYMSFFKIILVIDKDAQTKFSRRPSCQLHIGEREDVRSAVCEALFSCPGSQFSLVLFTSVSFQPLRCFKVVYEFFIKNKLGMATHPFNAAPRRQRQEDLSSRLAWCTCRSSGQPRLQ